jgi:hypothetical protein
MQVCKAPESLVFDVRCAPGESSAAVTAPCEVQWALQATGFAQGSACSSTSGDEPDVWTNTSSSAAVIHVAALVQQLKGSADSVQMQLYVWAVVESFRAESGCNLLFSSCQACGSCCG